MNARLDINPDALTLSDLRTRTLFRPDAVRMDVERLRELVRTTRDRDLGTLQMELTARQPYTETGYMDMYHPGRWDCESGTVYMSAIYQTGSTPGEWDGSVAYVRFTAPAPATYIAVANFSGYQQTMSLNGPWGTSTAHCATTAESAAATALWTAAAGDTLYCTFSSKSDSGFAGTAYLQSFQVFAPA